MVPPPSDGAVRVARPERVLVSSVLSDAVEGAGTPSPPSGGRLVREAAAERDDRPSVDPDGIVADA